jgi:anhydro-N-acetylmuramic acid kinase
MKESAMNVAGVMSGTSADGVDVALVRIFPRSKTPRLRLLAYEVFPYPAKLRRSVLAAVEATSISVAELARLQTRLGIMYADSIEATCRKHGQRIELIGCHGQTFYHQGQPAPYLGRRLATTWQAQDVGPIVERLHVPVVSDFRPADVAAGGQGAPLVPLLDYECFRHSKRARILQNLGGIGNLTLVPPNDKPDGLLAFDTGPGNMIMDRLMDTLYGRTMDRDGAVARRGQVIEPVLETLLRAPYFRRQPPKAAGREDFGRAYTAALLRDCRRYSKKPEDAVATATMLTARSVALSVERFVLPRLHGATADFVVSGGGAVNSTLMEMLDHLLTPMGLAVMTTDALGMPWAAKEAAAFALLAWNSWHHLPGNLPSATGARRAVVLGRVSYA